MGSFTGTFSADNQMSNYFNLEPGQAVDYSISTASLTGSVVLEKANKPQAEYQTIITMTDTASGQYRNESNEIEYVRLRCIELDDDPGSETVNYTLSEIVDASSGSQFAKAITNGVSSPYQLKESESGANGVFTNEGASAKVYINLPSAKPGLVYEFAVVDADGLRIIAASGDTIRLFSDVTPAAGYVESIDIGSAIRLFAISFSGWIATPGSQGSWTVSE
jgi:hypothetical protein|nr:MAG TPA: hypothetical protein [Caudoviricetes sp.]